MSDETLNSRAEELQAENEFLKSKLASFNVRCDQCERFSEFPHIHKDKTYGICTWFGVGVTVERDHYCKRWAAKK